MSDQEEESCEEINLGDNENLILDYQSLTKMVSSVSLESITSAISSASDMSEERLSVLRCVASYNEMNGSNYPYTTGDGIDEDNLSFNSRSIEVGNTVQQETSKVKKNTLRFEENGKEKGNCENKQGEAKKSKKCIKKGQSQAGGEAKYDPTLEKSQTYLHGQSKNFSRTNQYLTAARPGLRKLSVSYTQTNTENNQSVIFFDLVKNAHKRNIIINETVSNLERRLLLRRCDPVRRTTFYEQMNLKDPRRAFKKNIARTVAEKKKERKERILETTDDMKIGYKPTYKTMKIFTAEDIEKMRDCRYLRVDPKVT